MKERGDCPICGKENAVLHAVLAKPAPPLMCESCATETAKAMKAGQRPDLTRLTVEDIGPTEIRWGSSHV
jgi:uncharacterized Zn finger protein